MQKSFEEELDIFKNALKKHSLKATPQRMAVHKAMLRLGHASADMIVEEIKKDKGTNITTASIYNILSNLADYGIYGRRLSSNNKMYFDVSTFRHIHIYDCERHIYKDIVDDQLMDAIESRFKGRRFRGLSIESIDVQIVAKPTKRNLNLR